MRRFAVVTTGRADYGILRPLLRRLAATPEAALLLLAGGMHLAAGFGDSLAEIEADGLPIAARLPFLDPGGDGLAAARSMAAATGMFAEAYAQLRPEVVVVVGDRFEMHAAAVAAVPLNLPLAHIHGGELSLGAIDDAFRHSMTKLAHLHFVATDEYAKRVAQMGEEPWRITVCGALALDNLEGFAPLPDAELAARIRLPLDPAPLVVTFHPATLEEGSPEAQAEAVVGAVIDSSFPAVFTAPNADPGGRAVRSVIERAIAGDRRFSLVDSLGTHGYFSLMGRAAAMVGNSSSGIIEAASFSLPVVNVGARQTGRIRAANVIDAPAERGAILAAIRRAVSDEFRRGLGGLENPYRRPAGAAAIIAQRLLETPLGPRLLAKRFHDLPAGAP
jgi:UDP-hydrolysing UDP-N-acetyl-D-glucosamine 2-epimerase